MQSESLLSRAFIVTVIHTSTIEKKIIEMKGKHQVLLLHSLFVHSHRKKSKLNADAFYCTIMFHVMKHIVKCMHLQLQW